MPWLGMGETTHPSPLHECLYSSSAAKKAFMRLHECPTNDCRKFDRPSCVSVCCLQGMQRRRREKNLGSSHLFFFPPFNFVPIGQGRYSRVNTSLLCHRQFYCSRIISESWRPRPTVMAKPTSRGTLASSRPPKLPRRRWRRASIVV